MTNTPNIDPEIIELLKNVKSKRALLVAEHILIHGFITTDDIRNYGYSDPYRPTMDLKDAGIPLITTRVKNQQNRNLATYRFGNIADSRKNRGEGRKGFSKQLKQLLIERDGSQCAICQDNIQSRYLQIDHRVPYQVAGDEEFDERFPEGYMLVCGSCNRSKSWSCEHCVNFISAKDADVCIHCYWGNPHDYNHIALRHIRRLDIVWSEDETNTYDKLLHNATNANSSVADYVKAVVRDLVETE